MKKTITWLLLTAMLLMLVPLSTFAEIPKDYSENLVAYWNFEKSKPLNDKGLASTFANTLTEGSCVISVTKPDYDKVDENASVTYADGKVTVPANLGHSLRARVSTSGDDLGSLQSMTLGFRVSVDATSAGGAMVWRTNAFALMIGTYDKTGNSYTLQYRNEGSAVNAGDPFNGKSFSCGKDYFLFITVTANSDLTTTVTGYWSEDGETFVKGSVLTLALSTAVTPGYLFRTGANGSKLIFGKTQDTYVLKGASFTFDDIWIFNTAVSENSLSTIALHKLNPTDTAPVNAPAYRGCQLSAVAGGKFSTRFIGTVDTLDYAQVGFAIQITDYKTSSYAAQTYSAATVYESIVGRADDGVGGAVRYTAEDLGGSYIFALTVQNIPSDASVSFLVTAYHKTGADGEIIRSTSYEVVVENGRLISQNEATD